MNSRETTGYSSANTLVHKLKANDKKALQQLYAANYASVEKYVLQNKGTTDDAKDIFQEAFVAFWRNLQLERISTESDNDLSAYLFRVAKNKWIDHLRKNKKLQVQDTDGIEAEISTATTEQSGEEEKMIQAVQHHFKLLGESCKDLLKQFYFEKRSMKEIAEVFSWTEATARNNKYRCIEKLRTLLKENK